MDSKKAEKFKKHLLELRADLLGEVEKTRKTNQTGEFTEMLADVTDEAARSSTRQMLLNLGEQGREKLLLIDQALERIQQGEYGICVLCEGKIPPARLQVVPFAEHCVSCLNEIEKEKRLDQINMH